jgi:sugar-specific transcriptional regulator TrmB
MMKLEQFEKLNQEIISAETQQLKDLDSINNLNSEIRVIENKVLNEVCLELNDDGKPRFTNEMSRRAEQASRLNLNKEYSDLVKSKNNLENGKDLRIIELDGLKRMFSAMKSINYSGVDV